MALLLKEEPALVDAWVAELRRQAPDLELRVWPDVGDPADIEWALVWDLPDGVLATLPSLRAVFSVGAGVDHLLRDPTLPDVPVVRMVEPGLTAGMVEYVTWAVLHLHRRMAAYARFQRQHRWQPLLQGPAHEVTVGVAGLGELGTACLHALRPFGFQLAGWSRTGRDVDGATGFAGPDGLAPFLAATDVLVCLLPRTEATTGLLDEAALRALPAGASVVNVGRGGIVDESALVGLLDEGHLAGAVLDVTDAEPLPSDSPLWDHPRVTVTPHVASVTQPATAVAAVLAELRRLDAGEAPAHAVDRARGY